MYQKYNLQLRQTKKQMSVVQPIHLQIAYYYLLLEIISALCHS